MQKKNSYKTEKRVGDYVGTCMTCNMKFWASEGTILDTYTGLGNAWVCPQCVDTIDYGLVPYKVLPEQSVPKSFATNYESDATQIPNTIDASDLTFDTIDPMSINKPTTDPRLTS